MGRVFRVLLDSDLNMIRFGLSRFYWGAAFIDRWTNNRWPLRRADDSELITVGSEGVYSSNHESMDNEEFDRLI